MKFLPFRCITYYSPLRTSEVLERLQEHIEPKRSLTFRNGFDTTGRKTYEGSIEGTIFRVRRIINYKNHFRPDIQGEIKTEGEDTLICVKMSLPSVVSIFLVGFTIVLASIFMLFLFALVFGEGEWDLMMGIPLLMCLVLYAITMGAFTYESGLSKKHLAAVLEAKIQEDN